MLHLLIIPIIIGWLPIADHNIRMNVGILLGELLSMHHFTKILDFFRSCRRSQIVIAEYIKEYEINPLFDKVQDYIVNKFSKNIDSCELVNRNGDIEFNLTYKQGKKYIDKYEINNVVHIIELCIEQQLQKDTSVRQILLNSRTASSYQIKDYVKKISSIQAKGTSVIKIFRPIVIFGKKKEDKHVEWDHVTVKTNKTLENTIYSEEVEKELFNDIDDFMTREEWYSKRGIPYKRGYFLYGNPGQGKTSAAKIIANKYQCPVFCLDLTVIDENASLTKLMTEINYFVGQNKYILLIEDADRVNFVNNFRYYDVKLSMDCFLNVLDGVTEAHGRIIIMSANNPSAILNNEALIRPGRIDKIIELKSCDKYQLQKLYKLFYDDKFPNEKFPVDWDNWNINENLSSAYIIKIIQENLNNPDVFLKIVGECKNNKRDKSLANCDDEKIEKAKMQQQVITQGSKYNRNTKKKYPNKIEDKIRRTKKNIKLSKIRLLRNTINLNKANEKLPVLLEKLTSKKEWMRQQKITLKAIKLNEYNSRNTNIDVDVSANDEGKVYGANVDDGSGVGGANVDSRVGGEANTDDYHENAYDTPEFMMNSIPLDEVASDTIVKY